MKKLIAIITALLMLATFVGCASGNEQQSDLEYIKEKGTLIVGVTDFEPIDYLVDGEWTGFDAELAELIGEKLGVEVKFQEIEWSKKETELASKTIDCIWNGLTWDEERAENMSLTDNYLLNRQVLVVRNENADKIKSADDLKGKSVAAESESAGQDLILNKLADSNYIEKDAQIDALTELLSGTVDASVLDYIMAYYLINKEGSSFADLKIVENVVETDDEFYSVAFRKGSDVTEKVNEFFAEVKASGEMADIAAKYGLEDAIVK